MVLRLAGERLREELLELGRVVFLEAGRAVFLAVWGAEAWVVSAPPRACAASQIIAMTRMANFFNKVFPKPP